MKPPALADRILRLLVQGDAAGDVIGDLHEELTRFQLRELGPIRSRLWYWRQTLAVLVRMGRIGGSGARILARAPRERRAGGLLQGFGHDLVHGVRRLARNPTTTLGTAGVFALGLASATSIFTYVNGFYQPFPGVDADGLVQVFNRTPDNAYALLSYPDYLDLEATAGDVIAGVAANGTGFAASVRHETLTEVVFGQPVTGDYFSLLDVQTSLGRGLTAADDAEGAPPAVVISRRWWVRRWESSPDVLGSTVYLNNNPYTIVGVAGEDFLGSTAALRPDVWMPFEQYKPVYWAGSSVAANRNLPLMIAYVRLAEGTSESRGQEALEALAAGLDATAPLEQGTRSFHAAPATWIAPSARVAELPRNRSLLAAAALLVVLACANVANLLFAAATGRRREMALRAAQGASPGRLLQQVLMENVSLALVAGLVGLALAGPVAARIGSYFARPSVWGSWAPRQMSVDHRVFWFALVASVLAGVAAGLPPALRAARRDVAGALKESPGGAPSPSSGTPGRRRPRVQDVLVSVQVALAVVLLVTCGLVLRSLQAARDVDAGFDTGHLVASYMSTSSTSIPPEGRRRFYAELADRLTALPWVRSATVAAQAPLSPHPSSPFRFGDGSEAVQTTVARVVPNYFETLGMQIVSGRAFAPGDSAGAPWVAIVDERLAERYFPGEDPVGRSLWWPQESGEADRDLEIVGVVSDARIVDLLTPHEPVVYVAYPQHYYTPGNALVVAPTVDPRTAVPLLEREIRAVSNHLAIVNTLPYRDVVEGLTYPQRMNAELFSVVALLGLALAAAGVFGVLSLAVASRTREIGIRLAVGASGRDVVRAVLGRVAWALAAGVAVGLAVAAAAEPLLQGLLFELQRGDPVARIWGVGVLFLAAALAVRIPVRRALRLDPAASLRAE